MTGEGLQFFTYAWQSWPLSSEGSLLCHNCCDTGLPFIMVISEEDTHTCYQAFNSGAVTTCFYDLDLLRLGIGPRSPACEANALPLRHRGGLIALLKSLCFESKIINKSQRVLSRLNNARGSVML